MYNHTDFNRVIEAQNYIWELVKETGISERTLFLKKQNGFVKLPNDWIQDDPRLIHDSSRLHAVDTTLSLSRIKRSYMSNITTLADAVLLESSLPETLDNMDYRVANDIEKLLSDIAYQIPVFVNGHLFSGEPFCGEGEI